MKIIKFSFLLFFLFLFISLVSIPINGDSGPKPFVIIEITGIGDKAYTATLISKEAHGPNFFYNDYLEFDDPWMEFHPIMEYEDSEGYKWIGKHWQMYGDGELKWSYYPPNNFKVIIITEDNEYYTTKVIERYAFGSYFKVDVSNAENGELNAVILIQDVEPNYNYMKEVISFLIRLILTVVIEIGLAIIFGFRKKSHLLTIFIVNVITQVFLNSMLNIMTYFEGQFVAMGFFIIGELIVLAAETIFYAFYFKNQRLKVVLYGILANVISFGLGFGLYFLEQTILK